ncbi:DUF397 domain-containing protein [Actinoallomurus soli]
MDRPGLIRAEWRKSTHSGEENTSCVEVAAVGSASGADREITGVR